MVIGFVITNMKKLLALLLLFGIVGCVSPQYQQQTYKSSEQQRCFRVGGDWTSGKFEMYKQVARYYGIDASKELKVLPERVMALINMADGTEYCKTNPFSSPYGYSGSSRGSRSNDDEDKDEDDELLDDAMFDEGAPQCDEGTWYEENGYC